MENEHIAVAQFLAVLKKKVLKRNPKSEESFNAISKEVAEMVNNPHHRPDDIRTYLLKCNKRQGDLLHGEEVLDLYTQVLKEIWKIRPNFLGQMKVDVTSAKLDSMTATQRATVAKLQKSGTSQVEVEDVFTLYNSLQKEHLKKQGSLDFNDAGNAKRFVNRYKGQVIYNSTRATWYLWNGKYWENDEKKKVLLYAQETAKEIYSSAQIATDPDRSNALGAWARRSNNQNKLDSMIYLAQSHLPVTEDELDQNNYLFNVANGTYDLENHRFQSHNPDDNLTKMSELVHYDAQATCPEWLKFLEFIFEGNQDIINFIQRAVGYSLCGDTSGQCFFFAYGTGKNGKTAFFNVLKMLFGDYHQKTQAEIILQRKNAGGGIPNDIARLKGARFVVASELPEGRYLNEEVIKDLTGSDDMAARFLYKEWFEFTPTHKLWIYGNHKPIIRGQDPAIWRRPKLIPFNVKIPKDKEIPMETLLKTMKAELSGIFNWALEGFNDYQKAGLEPPKEIEAAVEEFRQEMNIVEGFIDECLIEAKGKRVKVSDVYTIWLDWCKQNGELPGSGRAFVARLKQHDRKDGGGKYDTVAGGKNIRYWEDVDVNPDVQSAEWMGAQLKQRYPELLKGNR